MNRVVFPYTWSSYKDEWLCKIFARIKKGTLIIRYINSGNYINYLDSYMHRTQEHMIRKTSTGLLGEAFRESGFLLA